MLLALSIAFLSFFGRGECLDSSELQAELKRAKKELSQAEKKVKRIEEKLAAYQIAMIQKSLINSKESFDESKLTSQESIYQLFHQERTLLAEIIQKVPSCSQEAQSVLDEILSLITTLADAV